MGCDFQRRDRHSAHRGRLFQRLLLHPVVEDRGEVVERGGRDERNDGRVAESRNPSSDQKLAEDPRHRGLGYMITTPDLIDSLARGVAPVRRLRPPLVRAFGWLLLATIILGLLAISQGIRPDLSQRLQQTHFVIGITAALLTGACAAIAAVILGLAGRSRRLWC